MARADRQWTAAKRREEVSRLKREEKLTFEEIGARLGVTKQRAYAIWAEALRQCPAPNVQQHRTDATEFADQMIRELLDRARDPQTTPIGLAGIHREIRGYEEHRAKLLGTYLPIKREITVIPQDAIEAEIRELTRQMEEADTHLKPLEQA